MLSALAQSTSKRPTAPTEIEANIVCANVFNALSVAYSWKRLSLSIWVLSFFFWLEVPFII